MKKVLFGVVIGIVLLGAVKYISQKKEKESVIESSAMIEKQIKNVGKLIVTEGYFSDIMTYKDSKGYLSNMISFDKKAIIVINAKAQVSFDLSGLEYDIDQNAKTLTIKNMPKAELEIFPKLEYHSLEQSSFNLFEAEDYNKIKDKAQEIIRKKVEQSTMVSNSENRLISELSKILILTNSLGWKLIYNGKEIKSENEIQIKG